MNILVVSPTYPEPKEYKLKKDTLAVHYFTKQWVKDGHEVLVVHPYFNGLRKIFDYFRIHNLGIRHYNIDGVNVVFGSTQILLPHAIKPYPFQERNLAKRIKRYIRDHFPSFIPDVISVHFPFVLGEFVEEFCELGMPAFAVFHGTDVRCLLSLNYKKKQMWANLLNSRYKQFGFRAPLLLERCCDELLTKSKSTLVLSGLDEALIPDEQTIINKAKLFVKEKTLSIIFAGKVVKQKRIGFILEALSLIKNEISFQFYIVGDGEELPSLQKTTIDLGLNTNVVFVGRVRRDELSNLMLKSDIFIMLSTNETLGLVYLEAMAQGCIPIGSKGEGIDGIIKNGENGFLCDPYDVEEVSESIRKVYSLTQIEREQYILNAYYSVNNLTEKSMADLYMNELKQISNNI